MSEAVHARVERSRGRACAQTRSSGYRATDELSAIHLIAPERAVCWEYKYREAHALDCAAPPPTTDPSSHIPSMRHRREPGALLGVRSGRNNPKSQCNHKSKDRLRPVPQKRSNGDQAVAIAGEPLFEQRYAVRPTHAKPISIIVQVEGNGVAALVSTETLSTK